MVEEGACYKEDHRLNEQVALDSFLDCLVDLLVKYGAESLVEEDEAA